MKYIIDVPNEAIELMGGHISIFVEPVFKTGDCKRYALRLSKENIEPYTEPKREAIENEVWEFARAVNDMRYDDFVSCFGGKTEEAVYELSYSEVKAEYDAWKRTKEEIRVGDEIEAETGKKACVLYTNPDGTQLFVFKVDGTFAWWSKCTIHKTGKKYSEFAELLKKMRDAE